MKWQWIIFLTVSLAAAVAGFAIARQVRCPDQQHTQKPMAEFTGLTEKLDLTDEQQKEIAELHASLAAEQKKNCEQHCTARVKLGHALGSASSKQNDEKIERLLEKMCRANAESERTTLRHIMQIRKVLNPKQRRRFEQLLESSLCRECPVCGEGEN